MSNDSSERGPSAVLSNSNKLNSNFAKIKSIQNASLGLGNPFLLIVKVVLIFIASQLISVLIVGLGQFIYSNFQGDTVNYQASVRTVSNRLESSAAIQFFVILTAELLVVVAVYFLLKIRKRDFKYIGYSRYPVWNDLKQALIGFGFYYVAIIISGILISVLIPSLKTDQTQDVGFNSLASQTDQILAFISLVVLAPIAEETLVRGYLYSGLRARWRISIAAIITSLVFGLAHLLSGENGALIWMAASNTFFLSLVLIYLREKTGALYACILLHSLNNLIAFAIHFHESIF